MGRKKRSREEEERNGKETKCGFFPRQSKLSLTKDSGH